MASVCNGVLLTYECSTRASRRASDFERWTLEFMERLLMFYTQALRRFDPPALYWFVIGCPGGCEETSEGVPTMPLKQNQRRAKNLRRQKRKNGGKAPSFTPVLPFVGNKRTRLVFGGFTGGIEQAAGAGIYNFYRLNGPYDPDTAVFSAQTPGLAAIAQLYSSMRVWKAIVSATGVTYTSPTNAGAIMVSLVPTATQPVLPSQPYTWPVQRLAHAVKAKPSAAANGGVLVYQFSVSGTFEPHVVLNITPGQYKDEADYASTTNGNPTRQLYVALAVCSNVPLQVGYSAFVRIEYEVEFFNPQPLQ